MAKDPLAGQLYEETGHVFFVQQRVDVGQKRLQTSVHPRAVAVALRRLDGTLQGFLKGPVAHPTVLVQHSPGEDVEIGDVIDVKHFGRCPDRTKSRRTGGCNDDGRTDGQTDGWMDGFGENESRGRGT